MDPSILYKRYDPAQETQLLESIRGLISKDLSEPYSIYVYRYFLYQWGNLCYMASDPKDKSDVHTVDEHQQAFEEDQLVGVVVCKLEPHRNGPLRGYIAMLAVRRQYRGKGIGKHIGDWG
jgi:peptide alpha-N-acetyltransferase